MSTTYNGADTYPTSLTIPADGDPKPAASVNVAIEGLADRTTNLKGRVISLETRATKLEAVDIYGVMDIGAFSTGYKDDAPFVGEIVNATGTSGISHQPVHTPGAVSLAVKAGDKVLVALNGISVSASLDTSYGPLDPVIRVGYTYDPTDVHSWADVPGAVAYYPQVAISGTMSRVPASLSGVLTVVTDGTITFAICGTTLPNSKSHIFLSTGGALIVTHLGYRGVH